jgi:DNA-binding MarR family transcriptional regulator
LVKQSGQPSGRRRSHPDVPPLPSEAADDDLHHVANAMHSASLRLLRQARSGDALMDLDGPRASALSVLVFGGAVPIGRLAEIEQVSAPAITKTVAALEAAGLAERVRSTSDRRVVNVMATAAGRHTLERGRAERVRRVADLLRGLSPDDLDTVARAARLVSERLADS